MATTIKTLRTPMPGSWPTSVLLACSRESILKKAGWPMPLIPYIGVPLSPTETSRPITFLQRELIYGYMMGGGMAPKQQDYFDFLKMAVESSTVCLYLLPMPMPMLIWSLESTMQKHIQSNYCSHGCLKVMRQDRNCCYCLCKTRFLLSKLHGRSFQGRTTEKC